MRTLLQSLILAAVLAASMAALPPPIIPTFLPILTFLLPFISLRNFIASITPSAFSFGICSFRDLWAPAAINTALYLLKSSLNFISFPTFVFILIFTPEFLIFSISILSTSLGNLYSGMQAANAPPGTSDSSKIVILYPLFTSLTPAMRPAGPEPIIATFSPPVFSSFLDLVYIPSFNAYSETNFLSALIAIGLPHLPARHLDSQGWWHTLAQTAGRGLSLRIISNASLKCLLVIRDI